MATNFRMFVFVFVALLSCFACNTVVETKMGKLRGFEVPVSTSSNQLIPRVVNQFFGIPYAEPPVGDFRFRRPRPFTSNWTGERDATKFGSQCVQYFHGELSGSEDCLFVNVYVPKVDKPGQLLPVMVWIHGGSFIWFSGSAYDVKSFSSVHSVVVVTLNYRLGILGFLANKNTLEEEKTTGNWAMLDQREALKWVHENIRSFGGDPGRVALVGNSAGAFSVQWHLTSEGSYKYFHRAIVMSGGAQNNYMFQKMDDSFKFYEWAATVLGLCESSEDMECLRRIPASRLVTRQSDRDGEKAPTWGTSLFAVSPVGPTIDHKECIGVPVDVVGMGKAHKVSVMVGVNKDEGSIFVHQVTKVVRPAIVTMPLQSENILDVLNYFFPKTKDRIKKYYEEKYSAYNKTSETNGFVDEGIASYSFLSDSLRDFFFHCPSIDFTKKFSAFAKPVGKSVWFYDFTFLSFKEDLCKVKMDFAGMTGLTTEDLGVYHTADTPIALKMFSNRFLAVNDITMKAPWNLYMSEPMSRPGDVLHRVSDIFSCLLANFIYCDDPNGCVEYDTCYKRFKITRENVDDVEKDGINEVRMPVWTRFSEQELNYLSIDESETTTANSNAKYGRMKRIPKETLLKEKFGEIADEKTCNDIWKDMVYEFHDLKKDLNLPESEEGKEKVIFFPPIPGEEQDASKAYRVD